MTTAWSRDDVYEAEVKPLMEKVVDLCRQHEIPLVAVLQPNASEDGTVTLSTSLVPQRHMSGLIGRVMRVAADLASGALDDAPEETPRVAKRARRGSVH